MRVITGTARGRRLSELPGDKIRPTTDMIKEALFNIVQFDIEGRNVLDLFAGSGQLGIEALSRGAASVTFIDESPAAIKIVTKNLEHCKLTGKVIQDDALRFIMRSPVFDLILIDPPYDSGLYVKILQKINQFDILSIGGIIVCESQAEEEMPEMEKPYEKGREYRYGKVKLTVYKKDE